MAEYIVSSGKPKDDKFYKRKSDALKDYKARLESKKNSASYFVAIDKVSNRSLCTVIETVKEKEWRKAKTVKGRCK